MGYYYREPPLLDHHFRAEWDEERGLQTFEDWENGSYAREAATREWHNEEATKRKDAEGWISEEEIDRILVSELKLLGRPDYDKYRLEGRFRDAIRSNWPKELFPLGVEQSRYMWLLPLPKAGREETIRLLHTIAYRGLRTGSLPKAVQDVIRSRRIKGREEQGRVLSQLAK